MILFLCVIFNISIVKQNDHRLDTIEFFYLRLMAMLQDDNNHPSYRDIFFGRVVTISTRVLIVMRMA
jgi:hypothetical protein